MTKTGKRKMCFDGFFAVLLFNWSKFLSPTLEGRVDMVDGFFLKPLSHLEDRSETDIIFILQSFARVIVASRKKAPKQIFLEIVNLTLLVYRPRARPPR